MAKKIKATELKNANIQFISLVDKGSNGRPFSFVKSEKDKKRVDIKNIEKMNITEKDKGVFKKIYDFLFTPVKVKKEDDKVDEILKAIKTMSDKFDNVALRLEKLENQEDPELQDDTEGQEDLETDEDDETVNEIVKMIGDLTGKFEKMDTRLTKIEKRRQNPRSQEDIGRPGIKKQTSVFKGIFS